MGAPVDALVLLARYTVGGSFILSGVWKFRHPAHFKAAFHSLLTGRLSSFDGLVARGLPVAEIAIGACMLAASWVGRAAAVAAFLMVVSFTALLVRARNLPMGCGCWRKPIGTSDRAPVLFRNICLGLLAIVGTIPTAGPSLEQVVFGVAAGILLAVVLMEIPLIASVAQSKPHTT